MGGGTSSNSSSSRPLTAKQMINRYSKAMATMDNDALQSRLPGEYTPVTARSLSNGDYDRLEQNIVASRTAPLERAWSLRKGDINQEMSDRGLWSSGAPIQQQGKEFEQSFLPAYQQAGTEAAAQRYGMQDAENKSLNAFNADQAGKQYDSRWRPQDYKAGIWNGSGGTVSSGSGGGWNFSI